MRVTLLLVAFAALLASASALTIKERLQRLERNEFGRHLLDIIQVQLSSAEDPVKTILDLLEQLRQDLLKELEGVEEIYTNAESDCNKTLPALGREIKKYQKKRVAAEGRLATVAAEIDQETLKLKENQRVVDSLDETITKLENDRAGEVKQYEDALADVAKMREGLKKAKEILSKLAGGSSSFLELSAHAESALKVDYEYANGLGQLAKYFIQMASTADPALLKHIFDVIDKIIEQLSQNEYALTQAETAKAKVFEGQMYQQHSLLFAAQEKVRDVQSRINAINVRRQKAKTDIDHYVNLAAQKQKEREDKTALCQAQRGTRDSRNNSIEEQLAIIDEVITLVQLHLQPVKDHIATREESPEASA